MNQKIALITGAGSGVGLACAQRLAKDGFTLVLTGRQQDKIDAACAALDGQGHIAVAADVGVEAEVDALFERVETTFGRLDLLFNNAGRNGPAVEVDGLSVAEWNDIVATNLTGSFLCARAAFAFSRRLRMFLLISSSRCVVPSMLGLAVAAIGPLEGPAFS